MAAIIDIKAEYLDWLMQHVDPKHQYYNFLQLMDSIPFKVINPMDENRVGDVESILRNNWLSGFDKIDDTRVKNECAIDLSHKEISMFEILVAFCIKLENNIFYDPTKPDINVRLFWEFIDNVVKYGGFGSRYMCASQILTDDKWDRFVEDTMRINLERINDRKYMCNGRGGYFPTRESEVNQRKVEMWLAANEYIKENYKI